MSKQYIHHSSPGSRRHRFAFTLIELVVSIGILSLLLVMAGSIFTLTLKSSGQATALIEVSESVTALEQTLGEDLRYVQPGKSIMVIKGNRVKAYWDRETMEADDDDDPTTGLSPQRDPVREKAVAVSGKTEIQPEQPRADVIMFFTARPGSSYRDPQLTGQLQQVVYGHAETGRLAASGAWKSPPVSYYSYTFAPDQQTWDKAKGEYILVPATAPASYMPTPAAEWHLARRSVLILDQLLAPPDNFPAGDLFDEITALDTIEDDPFCDEASPKLKQTGCIRDARRDYVINGSAFDFSRDVTERLFDLASDRIAYPADDIDTSGIASAAVEADRRMLIQTLRRSQLDLAPPVEQRKRVGHQFMQNCASFKVEWALDLKGKSYDGRYVAPSLPGIGEVIWIDPGNFAKSIDDIYRAFDAATDECDADSACDAADFADDRDRWKSAILDTIISTDPEAFDDAALEDPDMYENYGPMRFAYHDKAGKLKVPSIHAFYAAEPMPLPAESMSKFQAAFGGKVTRRDIEKIWPPRADPLFPKALRITVDLYDSAGRLEKPIRHVMILPVGDGR